MHRSPDKYKYAFPNSERVLNQFTVVEKSASPTREVDLYNFGTKI